jgi:carbon storage regulator
MLILARLQGEIIDIGPEISITVIEIREHKVRLGIQAPRNLAVDRREVSIAKLKASGTAFKELPTAKETLSGERIRE